MLSISALSSSTQIASCVAAGGGAGAAFFASLLVNARTYARHAIVVALVLQTIRFAMLGLVLYGLARLGPAALLAGLAGVVIARYLVMRCSRHAP